MDTIFLTNDFNDLDIQEIIGDNAWTTCWVDDLPPDSQVKIIAYDPEEGLACEIQEIGYDYDYCCEDCHQEIVDDLYDYEFHDCDGRVKSGNGFWIPKEAIILERTIIGNRHRAYLSMYGPTDYVREQILKSKVTRYSWETAMFTGYR
jgi:hypothetical protein